MNDSPPQPAAKPKISRWGIAGLVFLLAPFLMALGFSESVSGHTSYVWPAFAFRPFCVFWFICSMASIACCVKAFNKLSAYGRVWEKRLAYTAACIGTASFVFAVLFLCAIMTNRRHPHPRTKTKVQIMELVLAVKQYQFTYGALPTADGLVQDRNRLYAILEGKNPRKAVFISELKTDKDGRRHYTDQWGNDFIVVLSSSGTIQAGTGGICQTINDNVAVWSKGPNRIDDHGAGDDICSWK